VSYVPEMGRVRECDLCSRVLRIVASAEGYRMCAECAVEFAEGEIDIPEIRDIDAARAEVQHDLDSWDEHE